MQQERTLEQIQKINTAEHSVRQYQAFIIRIAALLLILWALFFQVIGLTHAPNADMYPRVDAGDLLLFYRLDRDVRSQDVVLLEKVTPDSAGEKDLYCARVVASAGDTVDISDDGRLLVNGSQMIESNIFSSTWRYEGFQEYPVTLGEGECFVLADRREGGTDSRYFGPVSKDEIAGTVITVIRRTNL
ncbi:MAG: signal peptidase I [Firmicutes bacterium]|nr:signal peptidase I [Bacillota bacterium]